jgi:hypothetical protein
MVRQRQFSEGNYGDSPATASGGLVGGGPMGRTLGSERDCRRDCLVTLEQGRCLLDKL